MHFLDGQYQWQHYLLQYIYSIKNCTTVSLQLKVFKNSVILFTKQIRKNRIASYYIFWCPYRAAVRATPYRIMYSRQQNTWCFCKTHERQNGQTKALEWGWKQSVRQGRNTKKLLAPGKNWFLAWIIIHVFRKQNRLFAVKRLPYSLEYEPWALF